MAPTVPVDEVLRFVAESDEFSPRTRKQYREHLLRMMSTLVEGGIDPLTLTAGEAAEFLGEYAMRIAPRTYNLRLAVMRRFYDWFCSSGARADNPVEGFSRLPEPPAPRDAVTVLELRALLLVCKDARERAVIALLGIHALPIEDILSLRVTDYRPEPDPPMLRLPRRGSGVEIPLTRLASEAIRECVEGKARDPLIRNRYDNALNSANVRAIVESTATRAEIERRVTPAMLTHSMRYIGLEHGFTFRSLLRAFPEGSDAARVLTNWARRAPGPQLDHAAFRIASLVEHDIATTESLLNQAERIIFADDLHPAAGAVLAAGVLERHLREWVRIREARLNSRPTLSSLASALRQARYLTEQDTRDLLSLAEGRDKAAHGRFDEVDMELALSIVRRVREFLQAHPLST